MSEHTEANIVKFTREAGNVDFPAKTKYSHLLYIYIHIHIKFNVVSAAALVH